MNMQFNQRVLLVFISLSLFAHFSVYSNDAGMTMYEKGMTFYSNGKYLEALYFFSELISEEYSSFSGDAYFWSAKSYLAAGNIEKAEQNFEFFLLNFPQNANYNEGFYYKGRILFVQKEYEKSLELFNRFIRSNPFSPFTSNAYYWIGDCLYNTGHFDEALNVFKKVVSDYPSGFKKEAAQYKISLIDYRFREEELHRLIRWSHEETMRTLEDYRNREKNYLQTIEAYQKRIIEIDSGNSEISEEALKRLSDAAEQLEDYLDNLKETESRMENDENNSE